jgi:hypothetical protein
MRTRFETFALALHPEKTRLIEFGRQAAVNREKCGLGKPETFNFLGFTMNDELKRLALNKDTPLYRPAQTVGRIASVTWLGGLHRHYVRMA